MDTFRLGRTGLQVSRSGFGAIPIQRLSFDDAAVLLRRAYEGGINFFDTARAYGDSEEKIAYALSDVRAHIILASKTMAETPDGFQSDLETSLRNLKTDHIDIYQFHNPAFLPDADHPLYRAALRARREGKIRFISVTNHRLDLAIQMVRSGLFDTMQFPLSALSSAEDLALVELCRAHDVGLIVMKAMSGGLITDPTATFALLRSLGDVVPIWGLQHLWELEQFLALEADPPALTPALRTAIERDKQALAGAFCRACGYCMPTCPAGIQISTAARMSLLLRRMNPAHFVTPEMRALMEAAARCTDCGLCKAHCPYGLDTPALLRREHALYRAYLAEQDATRP
ncbi:MAG: aldo/keto reductase [Oscillospiraceae bacterium]|jgi:aryl-alcohol dehydrogenase-like predicted oxidoreductase/Pyruvate/2-oxoacid:ferredoxin oxidoreductase delta subunit|nr:aldo/keto reductase [Oscillospiraceae bacterium]